MIQPLEGKRPKLSNLNQTQNRKRYINFENCSYFICSLNLKIPELTVFIAFKMANRASGNQEFVNTVIGNTKGKIKAKHITFYRTYSGLGLLIWKAHGGVYVAIANDSSSIIPKPDLKFPSSKSNCTDLNKWHVISVTWSNKGKNLSYCWCNGKKLIMFTIRNVEGSDHCFIGNFGRMPGLKQTHLTGCIGEIIAFYETLDDKNSWIFNEKMGNYQYNCFILTPKGLQRQVKHPAV